MAPVFAQCHNSMALYLYINQFENLAILVYTTSYYSTLHGMQIHV